MGREAPSLRRAYRKGRSLSTLHASFRRHWKRFITKKIQKYYGPYVVWRQGAHQQNLNWPGWLLPSINVFAVFKAQGFAQDITDKFSTSSRSSVGKSPNTTLEEQLHAASRCRHRATEKHCYRAEATDLFETESYSLVYIHAKGYQFDTHISEMKICSICQLCYHW